MIAIPTTLAFITINSLLPLFGGVILIAIGFIIYNLMDAADQASNQAKWKNVANRLELTHKDPFFFRPCHIRGILDGVKIRAENHEIEYRTSQHGPKKINHRNILKADFNHPMWKEVKIIRYEAAEQLAIAFGGSDIKTGIPTFDNRLRIAGKDVPETVIEALRRPDVQEAILKLEKHHAQFYINKGQLYMRWEELFLSPNELREFIESGVELVNLLDAALETFPDISSPT